MTTANSERRARMVAIGRRGLLVSAIAFCASGQGWSAEPVPIVLDGTALRGNRENPQVLFVIPWKTEETPPIITPRPEYQLDGLLQPIQRQTFRAQLEYRREGERKASAE